MNPARFVAGLLLVIMMTSISTSAEPNRLVTVEEAVLLAVSRNPEVLAARLEPAAAEADYRKALGIYNPRLFLEGGYLDRSVPSSIITEEQTDTKLLSFQGGASQLFSSGGAVSLGMATSRSESDPTVRLSHSPAWDTAIFLDINQPLLKNFGAEPTELAIRVARQVGGGSLQQFKTRLMDTVLGVTTEYYTIVSIREELEVRRSSLSLARKILADTRGRVDAGVLPAMEILNAEFGLAAREKEFIDTERSYQDRRDALAYLLQIQDPFDISGISSLNDTGIPLDDGESMALALANRPEIREQQIAVATAELQERVARNGTLPELSLTAGVKLVGLYDSYHRSADQVTSADYPSWNAGLRLAYPLGNDEALNDHARTRVRLEQSRLRLKAVQESVVNEVRAALREVTANRKQLEVAERGRNYAEERFRAFQKKHEVGLATTRDLLDVENDLALALNNQIKARTDLAVSRDKLWRATGELLEKRGVEVADDEGSRQLGRLK
jgi:outer membrane protein TolC